MSPEPEPKKIAIATHTKYPNWWWGEYQGIEDTEKIRGDLALQTIQGAVSLGFRIVLADASSSPAFRKEVSNSGENVILVDSNSFPGRAPQRRAAFTAASNIDGIGVVVYTQPEKVSLIQSVKEISSPILRGEAELVIPKRDPNFFLKTYPDYMYRSEINVNETYNCVLKGLRILKEDEEFDWFFGPVVFKNDPGILSLFLEKYEFVDRGRRSGSWALVNPEMHSDGHYFPPVKALFQGFRIASVQTPFVYPETQKANEESPGTRESFQKRRRTDAIVYRIEFIHFVRYLRDDPKSKIRQVE